MVEAFQVDAENLRVSEYLHALLHVYCTFAPFTLIPAINHSLNFDKLIQAIGKFNIARETNCASRDFHWQIHEIIKSECLMPTWQTFSRGHQLSLEKIRHRWIISLLIVVEPFFRLFLHWQLIIIDFLVLGLLNDSIDFIMHTVNQEPHELLGIFFFIAWKDANTCCKNFFELMSRWRTPLPHFG